MEGLNRTVSEIFGIKWYLSSVVYSGSERHELDIIDGFIQLFTKNNIEHDEPIKKIRNQKMYITIFGFSWNEFLNLIPIHPYDKGVEFFVCASEDDPGMNNLGWLEIFWVKDDIFYRTN